MQNDSFLKNEDIPFPVDHEFQLYLFDGKSLFYTSHETEKKYFHLIICEAEGQIDKGHRKQVLF